MTQSEIVERLAEALWVVEQPDDERDGAARQWRGLVDAVEGPGADPHWSGGKHSGDCTNEAHPCARCAVEEKREHARAVLAALRDPAIPADALAEAVGLRAVGLEPGCGTPLNEVTR